MSRKFRDSRRRAALMPGLVMLVLMTGCVGDMPHRGAWAAAAHNKQVLHAFIVADVYSYYSEYRIYYNQTRHCYVYMEKGAWVTRTEPSGVPLAVLLASPAVQMDFQDSPAAHHASVMRAYPKTSTRLEPHRQPALAMRTEGSRMNEAAK